jgi:DNA polymerase III epsilon subunit-like protein
LETTSAKIESAGIVQIAAVALLPGLRIEPLFQTYCKPSEPMTPEAERVHGITPEYYQYAPIDKMACWVVKQITNGLPQPVVLSGYNSSRFDYPLIDKVWPAFRSENYRQLDAMTIAVRQANGASFKLGEIFQREFPGDNLLTQAHDAMADCLMVAKYLKKQVEQKTEGETIEALVEWVNTPQLLSVMPFGKHKGVPFKQVPASYLTWAADAWTDMSPDMIYTFKSLGIDTIRG